MTLTPEHTLTHLSMPPPTHSQAYLLAKDPLPLDVEFDVQVRRRSQ